MHLGLHQPLLHANQTPYVTCLRAGRHYLINNSSRHSTPRIIQLFFNSIFVVLYFCSLFAACHPFVSPDNFYRGCVFDGCHVANPAVECTSLQTYAAACAQVGVCLHWRNHTTLCGKQLLPVINCTF